MQYNCAIYSNGFRVSSICFDAKNDVQAIKRIFKAGIVNNKYPNFDIELKNCGEYLFSIREKYKPFSMSIEGGEVVTAIGALPCLKRMIKYIEANGYKGKIAIRGSIHGLPLYAIGHVVFT